MRAGRRGCRPRRRPGARPGRASSARSARANASGATARSSTLGRCSSTTTQVDSSSTGKLNTRERSERCAPSVLVALTGDIGRDERERAPRHRVVGVGRGDPWPRASRRTGTWRQAGSGPSTMPASRHPATTARGSTGARPRPAAARPRGAEHGGGDERRDRHRRVVEVDRRLGARVRERVEQQLGQRDERESRREQGEREQGQAAGRRGTRDRAPRAQPRRAATARRAACGRCPRETRRRPRTSTRTESRLRGRSAGRSRARRSRTRERPRRRSRAPTRTRRWEYAYQRPSAATTRPTCSFVVQASTAQSGEGQQPVLVEVPDRSEQQRRGERHGMEVVEHEPLGGRVEEVGEPEAEPGPLAAQVLPREQVDRNGAERDRHRLRDEQQRRVGPEPPERRERRRRSGRSARPAARSAHP